MHDKLELNKRTEYLKPPEGAERLRPKPGGLFENNPIKVDVLKGLEGRSILGVHDLSREEVIELAKLAAILENFEIAPYHIMDGKIVTTAFFEASTRTRLSFESAVLRLDGKVLSIPEGGVTGVRKGESLEDISMGWDDMLDDMGSEAEDAEPESEEEPEAEPEAEPDVDTSDVEEDESPDTDEEPDVEPESEPDAEVSEPEEEPAKDPIVETETSLEDGLAKTRTGFIAKLGSLFSKDTLDDDLVDEVEEVLFTADIGTTAAKDILHAIEERLDGDEKRDPAAVWAFVREYVEGILTARETKLDVESETPFVILVVGVNGVGKTTTIGKLASRYTKQGKSVMMVAGDTFRAAAVEQLGVWGERTGIPVHQGEPEADPASVIFEGIERGVEEGADVIICDTAGRLHTKVNLLKELEKIGRVAGKVIETAPHETILVLDANTGQNAIQQAKMFSEAVEISGIVLTKLDGTAKGGVVLGICEELDAPIRFIGIGEGVNDLREFDAGEFVEALFM